MISTKLIPCPLCGSNRTHLFEVQFKKEYLRCTHCQLTFLHPHYRFDRESELDRYNLHQNSPQDQGYKDFLSKLIHPLIPKLKPKSKGLDYGSGPGPTLSIMLEEMGFEMSIYDPFFAPDQSVLQRQYDFITCTETAEHFYNPAKEFLRLASLLKEGSWLGVMTELLVDDSLFSGWQYLTEETHVSFYKRETMEWLAQHYNWGIEIVEPSVCLFQKVI